MNRFWIVLSLPLMFPIASFAASQSHCVDEHMLTLTDQGTREVVNRVPTVFSMIVIGDWDGVKNEREQHRQSWITARPNEPYTLRLYNPLPVRVAVNVTVDGLNTLTGQPSGMADGRKWMIEPYGTLELRGWQIGHDDARRFFFTDKPRSYAQWRENQTGLPVSQNVGVIGAAFFWNQHELDEYYASRPVDQRTPVVSPAAAFPTKGLSSSGKKMTERGASAAVSLQGGAYDERAQSDAWPSASPAATGMGEQEANPTQDVEFTFDRGMYSARQAITIYYDFAPVARPNPFPDMPYAPEMPLAR